MRALPLLLGSVLVAALLFLAVASDRPSVPLRDSILAGSHHGRPAEILANAGVVASRVCVFGPYTSAATVNEVLGFNWPSAIRTGIESKDTSDLVVAADAHWVSAWTLVPRDVADFLRPDGYGCATVAPLGY